MKPLAPPIALRCLVTLCLFGVLAAAPLMAQGQRFTSPAGFSLNVPEGWQVLTKEQSQSVSEDLKAKTKFNPARMAAMIYSPTDPRININIIVLMGAVPMDDDAAKGYAQMLKDQSAQAGVALTSFAVNRHTYGSHSTLLADYDMDFSNSNGPNKDLGQVHQWQVVFSGTSNTFVVTCTAGATAFSTLAPVFERVLASMAYPGSAAPASAPLAPAPAPKMVPAPA